MVLPDGYLAAVYDAVRRHGGLAIADEVQVGYGRLGEWFWGFEQQGVVPDIVTVAKAMGNGHPLGAVITSRAVADAYRRQGYFFSSTGGSPVSCVVGLAVLDAMRDEGLQENARSVGEHLRRRLLGLAERHPLIGAVHGHGPLPRRGAGPRPRRPWSRRPRRPPRSANGCSSWAWSCSRRVMVRPCSRSSRRCACRATSADFFVDTLDRVLTSGW